MERDDGEGFEDNTVGLYVVVHEGVEGAENGLVEQLVFDGKVVFVV